MVNASTLERKPLPRHTHHIGSNDEYIIYWDEDGDGFIGDDSWQCDLDEFMDLVAFEDQQGTTFVQYWGYSGEKKVKDLLSRCMGYCAAKVSCGVGFLACRSSCLSTSSRGPILMAAGFFWCLASVYEKALLP